MVDMFRTVGSKAGFENLVEGLFKTAAGIYMGPENFNLITRPTASEEARKELKPAYHTMNLFFAKSLGETSFQDKWMKAYSNGFENLLKELEEKGPHYFINKDKDDVNFQAGRGGLFWDGIIKYIRRIGEKGFQQLVTKVQSLPKQVTSDDIMDKKLLDIDY